MKVKSEKTKRTRFADFSPAVQKRAIEDAQAKRQMRAAKKYAAVLAKER